MFIYIISFNPRHPDGQVAFLPLYNEKAEALRSFCDLSWKKKKEWQRANDWELKAKTLTMVTLDGESGPGSEA